MCDETDLKYARTIVSTVNRLFPILNSNKSRNNTHKLDKLISLNITPEILTTKLPEQKTRKKVVNKVKPVHDFIEQQTKEIDYDGYFKELGRDEIRNQISNSILTV